MRRPTARATQVVLAIAVALVTVVASAPAVLARAGAATDGASAVVLPQGRIGHAGRWMTDESGRVVVVHGVNMPTKLLPADPMSAGFGEDDATLLAASGLNAVRLTLERYAVAPRPGQFDDAYIDRFAATVSMLRRHGILSLIDFHQDEFGPVFFDNGYPDWMTMTDGLPNAYQVGYPLQYFLNPALNRAFDHLWANDIGPSGRPLWDDDADILARAASRLAGTDGLLGYEIMNEPWPGSIYPTCTQPAGCPLFDQGPYSDYHKRMIGAVRAADRNNLIWYEPVTTFNQGVPTYVVPPKDPNLGFAFHDYPLCNVVGEGADALDAPAPAAAPCTTSITMDNAEAHAQATGSALLETEFGATMDTSRLLPALAEFDQSMMPWMSWSYTRYITAYENDGKTLKPAVDPNVNHDMLATLARPYPQLVAGTPIGWSFDPKTRHFLFQYKRARADNKGSFGAGAETVISVPALQYPAGYDAVVTGGNVVSKPNAPILRVRAGAGAGPIAVRLTPSGGSLLANSACALNPGAGGLALTQSIDGSYPGQLAVCVDGTGVADGTVRAGIGEANAGSVIFDGRPGNPGLLAGFIGTDRRDTLTLVGCDHGDYDPNAPNEYSPSSTPYFNNAMASLGKPTYTAPDGPIGPTSPCSPQPYDPGPSGPCGGYQDPSRPPPGATYPAGSPLVVYTSGDGAPDPNRYGYAGVAGDFGGNDGASGYIQLTYGPEAMGDLATGGNSKGGGGTVAVGNDGREEGDRFTPPGLPVTVCQN